MKKTDRAHSEQASKKLKRYLFLGIMLVFAFALVYEGINGAGPLSKSKAVIVPKGADLNSISRKLKDEGVIGSEFLFSFGARLKQVHRELRAGEYRFPPGISIKDVLFVMREGQHINRRVTIAEGLNVRQVLEVLDRTKGLDGQISPLPEEGTLLPDTYYFVFGATRQSIVDQMRSQMNGLLEKSWTNRAASLPIKTKKELIILASIVEKETGLAAERRQIAGVFINRLKLGMRLESDPTVMYAVTGGKRKLARGLKKSELRREHPYNTYRVHGLPPGPICNPGRESIAAVLNPERTSALFFVADGTGGHIFSDTLKEHLKAVRKWRKIERSLKRRTTQAN